MHEVLVALWVVVGLAAVVLVVLYFSGERVRRRDLVFVELSPGGRLLQVAEPCRSARCPVYWCAMTGEIECAEHRRVAVCCTRPDLHEPLDGADAVTIPGGLS